MSAISKLLQNPPNNFSTTLAGGISASDLSIQLNSVSGLGSEGVGVIYQKDSDGNPVASSIEFVHWVGVNSGTNTITLTDTGDRGLAGSANSAQAHSSGDTFEVWIHSNYFLRDWALINHAQDGTHDPTTILRQMTLMGISGASGLRGDMIVSIIDGIRAVAQSGVSGMRGFILSKKLNPVFTVRGAVSQATTTIAPLLPLPQSGEWAFAAVISRLPVSGSSLLLDINKNLSSIFDAGNRLSIPGGGTYASTASLATKAFAKGDFLTLDIDNPGGSDLTVILGE